MTKSVLDAINQLNRQGWAITLERIAQITGKGLSEILDVIDQNRQQVEVKGDKLVLTLEGTRQHLMRDGLYYRCDGGWPTEFFVSLGPWWETRPEAKLLYRNTSTGEVVLAAYHDAKLEVEATSEEDGSGIPDMTLVNMQHSLASDTAEILDSHGWTDVKKICEIHPTLWKE